MDDTLRAARIGLAVAALLGCGCNQEARQPDNAPPAATEAVEPAPGKPAQTAPVANEPVPMKCEDFLAAAELSALGLVASPINPEMADAKLEAVRCAYKGASATIWRGDRYATIVAGIEANGKATGVVTEDGAKVGAETQWTTMPGVHGFDGKEPHTLNFVSPNKKFTGAVTGTDRAKLEQVARALNAKFEKM